MQHTSSLDSHISLLSTASTADIHRRILFPSYSNSQGHGRISTFEDILVAAASTGWEAITASAARAVSSTGTSGTSSAMNVANVETQAASTLRLAATIASLVAIPLLVSKFRPLLEKRPKWIWAIAFAINLCTVSLPGRFDNSASAAAAAAATQSTKVSSSSQGGPWTSIFAPSGWAFAIWGIIYLSELVLVTFACSPLNNQNSSLFQLLSRAGPAWLAGNLFQSLWCLSFRPALQSTLWVPALCLAGAAGSFASLHGVLSTHLQTLQLNSLSTIAQQAAVAAVRVPVALHTGWLCAATLLNINGWASYRRTAPATQVTLAFFSVYAAGLVALALGVRRSDPFLVWTVAWAAAGLADRTKRNPPTLQETGGVDAVSLGALAETERLASVTLLVVGGLVGALQIAKNIRAGGLRDWVMGWCQSKQSSLLM